MADRRWTMSMSPTPPPGTASRGILAQLRRFPTPPIGASRSEAQHPRNHALAKNRVAEHLIMHVPALGHKARVFYVPDNFNLVHAVRGARSPDDVFLDHYAAHVVCTEGEAQLPDFSALCDPRGLEIVEIIENDPRKRQGPQVFDACRPRTAELGVLRLITPRDEGREPAGLVLQLAQPHHVLDPLFRR